MSEKELEAKIAALQSRVDELERKANPPPKVEPTAKLAPAFSPSTYAALDRLAIPKEMQREMVKNVGTGGVRELVEDERKRRRG
jgi:hypothetical protein